jgi:HK97 gp10 family phage protein
MATTVTKIEGLAELKRALMQLPERIQSQGLAQAVYAGAAVIRDEARVRAPVYTGPIEQGHPQPGTLRKSIILKAIRERSSRTTKVAFVLVRHGKKYEKVGKRGRNLDAFYWRFVEYGTKKMAARPFMRPAFEAKKMAAVEAIRDRLAARIFEEAANLKR